MPINKLNVELQGSGNACPTIIVGLGGMGGEVAQVVKTRPCETSGAAGFPQIAFLCIDTELMHRIQMYSEGRLAWEAEAAVQAKEYVEATVPAVALASYFNRPGPHSHLTAWLDPKLATVGAVEGGSRGFRALGRLAFFHNYLKISEALRQAANEVVRQTPEAHGYIGESRPRRLHINIISSLMGGTGSGMFLDVAFLAGRLFKEFNPVISGYFIISQNLESNSPPQRQHSANTYAALTELQHYSYYDTEFFAQYATDMPRFSTKLPPFASVYLVGDVNAAGVRLRQEEVSSMLGGAIWAELTMTKQNPLQKTGLKIREKETQADRWGWAQTFRSLGFFEMYYPHERLRKMGAARLALSLADSWTTRLESTSPSHDLEVKTWVADFRLEHQQVYRALINGDTGFGVPLDVLVRDLCQPCRDRVTHLKGHELLDYLRVSVDRLSDEFRGWEEGVAELPGKWKDYLDLRRQLAANMAEAKGKEIHSRVWAQLNNPSNLLPGMLDFISAFRESLRAMINILAEERIAARESIDILTHPQSELLYDIKRACRSFLGKWKLRRLVKAFLTNFTSILLRQGEAALLYLVDHFYKELLLGIDNLQKEIAQFQDILHGARNLLGEFLENVSSPDKRVWGVEIYDDRYPWPPESELQPISLPEIMDMGADLINAHLSDGGWLQHFSRDRLARDMLKAGIQRLGDLPFPPIQELFFEKYPQWTDKRRQIQQIIARAQPSLRLRSVSQKGGACRLLLGEPYEPGETKRTADFRQLVDDQLGFPAGGVQWENTLDPGRFFVLCQQVGIPLGSLENLESLRQSYREVKYEGASPHARLDVQWRLLQLIDSLKMRGRRPQEISAIQELTVNRGQLKISSQKLVELDVDAIVCIRTRSLNLKKERLNSVHQDIQVRGGPEIDEEAAFNAPLAHGALCVTGAGTLPSDYIVHVGLIDDLDAQPLTEQLLREAVRETLTECERRQWKSIAMPLLGVRLGELTDNQVAMTIFEEVCSQLESGLAYPEVLVFYVRNRGRVAMMAALFAERRTELRLQQARRLEEQAASPGEDYQSSVRLRYAIEQKFPYPIARAFYQLRGIDDWLAEIPQLANILGVILQHLTFLALAEYVSGTDRDPELNRRLLETFKRPLSHGHWARVLQSILTSLQKRPEAHFALELLELYFPARGDQTMSSLLEMIKELVEMRNDLLKRQADSLPARHRYMKFKKRLIDLLLTLAFLKNYPLVSVKSTHTEGAIKAHLCLLHIGFHDTFEQATVQCDLDLEKTRVALFNPRSTEALYLYPFYILRECPEEGCRAVHLFRLEKMDKGRLKYITAGGHTLTEAQAGIDFQALLQGLGAGKLRQKASYLCIEKLGAWQRLPLGHRIDGKYEVMMHLRRGGMADVYQVREVQSNQLLAAKVLPFQFLSDSRMVQRFRQEAQEAQRFRHHNITRILGYGEDLVDHYIVMELAPGWRLADNMVALDVDELFKPMPLPIFLNIVMQTCDGLSFIHSEGMVHRDIKPGNLLLFENDVVKIADFGIARSQESITLTLTGLTMGTPEYMSPEQAEGKRDLTFLSDIYSLGIVMYEMLTGKHPFKRKTPLATVHAILHDPVQPPRDLNPEISEGLETIILKCLAKAPDDRYGSVGDLYEALTAYERNEIETFH